MTFRFSGTLLRFVDYRKEIVVENAATVDSALQNLVSRYPSLRGALLDADSNVRSTHRIILNGEVLGRGQTDRAVSDNDRLEILTAIAGG
jgi:molybdopterin converting factor small subunit